MLFRIFSGLCLILAAFTLVDEVSYPQDLFQKPVDGPIRLSGTFGELRPNHFHSGIDIKPADGKAGQPIFAAASGYVARIKVESGGYGKALYIKHPEGYTTVYAHLQEFAPEIETYVKQHQYNKKSFYTNLYPKPELFAFGKGQEIGRLGNSGGSSGPHLHFEIRKSSSGKPINPLLFGLPLEDTRPPKLHQLKVYELDSRHETVGSSVYNLVKKGDQYGLQGDTIAIGAWRAGFALKAYDHMDGVTNWNGIYSLECFRNDTLIYKFKMDEFSFEETRYINAHMDYEDQVSKKSFFNRCFKLPGSKLSIYTSTGKSAITPLFESRPTKMELRAKDAHGNTSSLLFWVRRGKVEPPAGKNFTYFLPYDEPNVISTGAFYARLEKGSLYENCYAQYFTTTDNSSGYFSDIHHFHEYTTPLHRYVEIAIRPTKPIPDHLQSKAIVAYCNKDNQIQTCGGSWRNGLLYSSVRQFGDYAILLDTIPPQIKAAVFKQDMRGMSKMAFKITDNLETNGKARSLQYTAALNESWILMEYDAKNDLITHYFDEKTGKGVHQLRIEVWDDRGNKSVLERTFER